MEFRRVLFRSEDEELHAIDGTSDRHSFVRRAAFQLAGVDALEGHGLRRLRGAVEIDDLAARGAAPQPAGAAVVEPIAAEEGVAERVERRRVAAADALAEGRRQVHDSDAGARQPARQLVAALAHTGRWDVERG